MTSNLSLLLLELIVVVSLQGADVHALNLNHALGAPTGARCCITQSSFMRRKPTRRPAKIDNHLGTKCTGSRTKRRNRNQISMLRNFDLPEALVLYGLDTVIDFISSPSHPTVRPGVLRLIDEARELAVPTFILSESLTTNELARAVESVEPSFRQLSSDSRIHYRSGLEEFVVDGDGGEDGFSPDRFVGEGIGHAPCPAALYDAVNSVSILPKGFGGADGFGVKNWEAARAPLPQHCVVFVCGDSDGNRSGVLDRSDGSGSISRDRCIAARYAGMRSIYIESEGRPCTADDVADGVVGSLGTEEDWEIVTLDDVSSPGSFWVNMMLAKDLDGMGVNTETVIEEFIERRRGKNKTAPSYFARNDPEPDEDELAKILADLESL